MGRTAVDTDVLSDTARATASASEALRSAVVASPDPGRATGEPSLATALSSLDTTWRAAHAALTDDLDALASALGRAALVLDGAESSTLRDVAGLLVRPSPPAVSWRPRVAV